MIIHQDSNKHPDHARKETDHRRKVVEKLKELCIEVDNVEGANKIQVKGNGGDNYRDDVKIQHPHEEPQLPNFRGAENETDKILDKYNAGVYYLLREGFKAYKVLRLSLAKAYRLIGVASQLKDKNEDQRHRHKQDS